LNKFDEATRLGLPVKPPERLHLIPEDANSPSNLLYHYVDAKDKESLVNTLGTMDWTVQQPVRNGANDDPQQVVFTADLPDKEVRITKTFTLAKGDYHIGLSVKLERTGNSMEPLPFRYQLTSGHGLPIEGEWYTYTYRNALIGLVDPS